MVRVARLVGMEIRKYEKDGKQRQYCGLHLMHLEGSAPEVMGSKVESVTCPQKCNPDNLEIGHLYQLEYDLYTVKGQLMARLDDLLPVEDK